MTDLHGTCLIGVIDFRSHSVVERADVVTITRENSVEMKPMLPPPESLWLLLYESGGTQFQTSTELDTIVGNPT